MYDFQNSTDTDVKIEHSASGDNEIIITTTYTNISLSTRVSGNNITIKF